MDMYHTIHVEDHHVIVVAAIFCSLLILSVQRMAQANFINICTVQKIML
jgi:hypothetical protein